MNRMLIRFLSEPALLMPGRALAMLHSIDEPQAAEAPFLKKIRAVLAPQAEMHGNLAVLPIEGVLAHRPDPFEMAFFGIEDSVAVLDALETTAASDAVAGILLNINSPGGFLTGGPEIAEAVARINQTKPVVAFASGMAASLAYWIGSQAQELIATRSSAVGSIGVFTAFLDSSKALERVGCKVEVIKNAEGKYKAAGLPGTSLTDDQRDHLQHQIQRTFSVFRKEVRAARPAIRDEAMQGQVFSGKEAKSAGLIDRVGDRPFALSVLRSWVRKRG